MKDERTATQQGFSGRGESPSVPLLRRAIVYALAIVVAASLSMSFPATNVFASDPPKKKADHGAKKPASGGHGEAKKPASGGHGEKKGGEKRYRKKRPLKKPSPVPGAHDITSEAVNAVGSDTKVTNASFDGQLGEVPPIDAVLVIDSSGSMQRTDPNRLRIQAAKLFVRFLGEKDRVAVFEFDKDARQLLDFTEVKAETAPEIERVIDQISEKGGFTNLSAPVIAAHAMLAEKGRTNATRAVVLLSDGQMDPHPENGLPEDLVKKLFESDLAEYKNSQMRLYSLAMSEEADRVLLSDMSKATESLSWYAQDVNTIHMKFSDLFLALKKPQVTPLDGGGFEIDSSIREATFYISRTSPEQTVSLVSPKGETFTHIEFPLGSKWYRGELFDIVTLVKPAPGPWGVRGVEQPEGYATLLTDLQVQVRWPKTNFKVGETVVFFARLVADGKPFQESGLKDITFYQYKVLNTRSGKSIAAGAMVDNGNDGDQVAGDGIFAAQVKLEEEGEYRALVGVTSPTFTRQQQLPFSVSKGAVDLVLKKGDEFAGTKDKFVLSIGSEAVKLKDLEVRLIAEKEGGKTLAYKVDTLDSKNGVYEFAPEKLGTGTFKITGRMKAKDKDKPGPAARLAAYHALVRTQQREGLYAMPCAAGALK